MNIEHATIGLIVKDDQEFHNAISFGLNAEMFSDNFCRKIFEYFIELKISSATIDIQTVCLMFKDESYKIIEMYQNAPVAQNAEFYFRLVKDSWWKRIAIKELSDLLQSIVSSDQMQDASKIRIDLKSTEARLNGMSDYAYKSIIGRDLVDRLSETLDQRIADHKIGIVKGIGTGMKNLDEAFGRWREGRLYVIAARPGIGKTTLAINFALEAAKQKKNCLFFTNEMTDETLMIKKLSNLSRVNSRKIEEGKIDQDEQNRIAFSMNNHLHNFIFINERHGRTIETIESEARRLYMKGNLDIIFLDYIQQVDSHRTPKSAMRHAVISDVSSRLEKLTKELKIPIVVLAQINRDGEKLAGCPSLSNIKDCGSIEQDADVVLILHRDRDNFNDFSELKIAKNRHGQSGIFQLTSNLQFNLFQEV